jgi:hypothetical protein
VCVYLHHPGGYLGECLVVFMSEVEQLLISELKSGVECQGMGDNSSSPVIFYSFDVTCHVQHLLCYL